MAKEQDQIEENQEQEDTKSEADIAAEKEEQEASAKAVKTSEDFDKKLDDEDVEDKTPSSEKKETTETDETKTEGDDKDAAEEKVEDDKVAAEKTDDAVKDEKAESKISEEVSKRAIDLGLTEEEIAEFETDSDLSKTLDVIDNIIVSTEGQEDVAQEPAAEKSGAKEEDSGFKLDFKNEDDIDPELLTNIKGMQKHYEGQLKELRNTVNSLTDNFKAEDTRRAIGRFDEMVEKLGDEFTDTFGKGPSSELSGRGLANKNRTAVRARMFAFAQGLNDAGQNVPEIQQLFDITVRSLFGKKMANVEGLRMHKKTTARSKGGKIGRSAARQTGTLTPQQKAVETSRKFDDLIDTAED